MNRRERNREESKGFDFYRKGFDVTGVVRKATDSRAKERTRADRIGKERFLWKLEK